MNKIISLPSMEFQFSIHIVGDETKKLWEGQFRYKRLTLGARMESAKMKCKLSEDLLTLPRDVESFNEMISHLRYGLIEFPDWWKTSGYGLNFYDVNVITDLYNKVIEFEEEWNKKVFNKEEEIKIIPIGD